MRVTPALAVLLFTCHACTTRSEIEGDESSMSACTEIGCTDGLLVRVSPTAAWPHGAYVFTVEADDTTTTCSGALPLPACDTRAITCDRPGVAIGESGCALPESEHAFSDIMFESNPSSVTIHVDRDGQRIGSQTWTPSYQTVRPNGPGCEPTCTNATVELALDFDQDEG